MARTSSRLRLMASMEDRAMMRELSERYGIDPSSTVQDGIRAVLRGVAAEVDAEARRGGRARARGVPYGRRK